ncbi:MAG: alpha/beta hydrolase [Acidobacteriota bacterium]
MPPFLERQLSMVRGNESRLHLRRLQASEAAGTILYIHGLGESALCFERLMADQRLAQWNHLAPDLVGYGKSLWSNSKPYSVADHAAVLLDLIDRLGLDSVVVLGHSMGGVIGTLLCEKLGDAAAGFVNVEGNISLPDCGYSSQAVQYSLDDWLDHGFDQVLDAIYQHEGESVDVRRAYGASILMCDPRAYHRNSEDLVELSRTESLAGRAAAVQAPTVHLYGAPRGTGERSLELLAEAGVETVRIGDAGHWPFLDQPDAFVAALARFLSKLEGEGDE